jgi:hypothetical protein
MAEISTKKLKYFLIFFLIIVLAGCANQLPPGGGEIDLIPPEIIEVFPADGTTNFNERYFEIGFSEYVDKRTVKDAIFISPAVEGELELDWSGRYVRVYFPENLKENVTYIVTVGTDVVDFNNNNRMAESFILTFSTGDKIDRKIISGTVYDEKAEGVMLFAYQLNESEINPTENKPDYISQTGTDGSYRLMGLADGTYRVFAVQDEFRDLIYQKEQDRYGAPHGDIILTEADSLYSGLNFFLSKEDTTSPRLISAAMTDRNHILLTFNEEIDRSIIRSNNFYIFDSTSQKKIEPRFAYKGNTKPGEMVLSLSEIIPLENDVFIFADTIKDLNSNYFYDDFSSLTLNDALDTTVVLISNTNPPAGSNRADFIDQKFEFFLNDGVDSTKAKTGITFSDTLGNAIPYSIHFNDDASFIIQALRRLDAKKDYLIKIDLSNFTDAAGNSVDSIYEYNFQTITGLDFTGASGVVNYIDLDKNPIVVLQSDSDPEKKFSQKLNEYGQFNFERVEPGTYKLWAYLDEDNSGDYSFGSISPFVPSEEFSYYDSKLELRSRWSQSDIIFNFKNELAK